MYLVDRNTAPAVRGVAQLAPGGLAGWLFAAVERLRSTRRTRPRQMQVMETLAVGGRNQLLLVRCGRERFLVGTGSEGISTMVQVKHEAPAREACHAGNTHAGLRNGATPETW